MSEQNLTGPSGDRSASTAVDTAARGSLAIVAVVIAIDIATERSRSLLLSALMEGALDGEDVSAAIVCGCAGGVHELRETVSKVEFREDLLYRIAIGGKGKMMTKAAGRSSARLREASPWKRW